MKKAIAILTLALGVGAAATTFSVVEAVLFRPLPYAGLERLTAVWENARKRQSGIVEISYPNYRDWRDQNRVFSRFAAFNSTNLGMNLTGAGEPLQADAAPVSDNFFSTLGVEPLLGRAFEPADDRLGARPVVELSDLLWREHFGGDPKVVGRQVKLNAQAYTVIGVMPAAFKYPRGAKLWVPLLPTLGREPSEQRNNLVLKGIGRMKQGVTLVQAQAEIEAIMGRLERQYMQFNEGFSATVLPFTSEIASVARPTLLTAFAGVLALLVIALADVAFLLRAESQRRLGSRLALGLLGGGGGLLLALLGIRLVRAYAPASIPRIDEIGLDAPTLLFTLAISLIVAAVCATVPARGGSQGGRMGRLLLGAGTALALVLLIGSGHTFLSLLKAERVDPGFAHHDVLTARIQLPETTYPDPQQRQLFFDRVRERAAALPGVTAAATVLSRPLDDSSTWDIPIARQGQTHEELERNPLTNFQAISPDYFRALGIPLLAGRPFDANDTESSALVAIVGKSLAKRFWPGQSPIGKIVRRTLMNRELPWIKVVGMVDDVAYRSWGEQTLDFYLPFRQNPLLDLVTAQDLILQTRGDPRALDRPLREAVYALDPGQALASVLPVEELIDRALAGPRFTLLVLGILAALALWLAALGSVWSGWETTGQALRRTLLLSGLGLGAGVAASFLATRFLAGRLTGVSSADLLTSISIPMFLALFALLAAFAQRAAGDRTDHTTRSKA